jgi:hypothetical protein
VETKDEARDGMTERVDSREAEVNAILQLTLCNALQSGQWVLDEGDEGGGVSGPTSVTGLAGVWNPALGVPQSDG